LQPIKSRRKRRRGHAWLTKLESDAQNLHIRAVEDLSLYGAKTTRTCLRPGALRRLIAPGITAFIGVLILLALGSWQIERLHWKEGILAQIAAGEANPAVPLSDHPGPYQKVEAVGHFRPDLAVLFGDEVGDTPQGQRMGGELIVPLERQGAPPVLVDRGWVPDPIPASLPWPKAEARVDGYVQAPLKGGVFTPAPDLTHRRFYSLDPAQIGAAVGLKQVAPFILIAMGPATPGQLPVPAAHLPRPPNNHLEYALIWFALAGGLVLVFGSWARTMLIDERH